MRGRTTASTSIILTGADPAFCAGVDLKEFGSGATSASGEGFADMGRRDDTGRLPSRGALPAHTKLLIGAINGVAVTGGFELALACDFLVASDRARFADTHARVGVMPGWGLTVLLPQRIGVARAREMSVTGNFIDAQQALRVGSREPRRRRTTSCCRSAASSRPTRSRSTSARCAGCSRPTPRSPTRPSPRAGMSRTASSREWEGAGFDPAEIEARRRGILERGRSQIGKE